MHATLRRGRSSVRIADIETAIDNVEPTQSGFADQKIIGMKVAFQLRVPHAEEINPPSVDASDQIRQAFNEFENVLEKVSYA
jgi:hypothetical protein